MTNWSNLDIFFNANKHWFLWIYCLDKEGAEPQGILDKRHIEFPTSLGFDSEVSTSATDEMASEFMLRSLWRCQSASILYVFNASTSSSLADFFCLFRDDRDPFLYPPRKLFSPSIFHFISTGQISGLAALSVLDCSSSVSDSSTSECLPSSESELISFAHSFQNYVPDSCSVSVISAVLRRVDSSFFEDLYWSGPGIFPLLTLALRNPDDGFEKKLLSLEYSWLGVNVWNNDSIRVLLPNLRVGGAA